MSDINKVIYTLEPCNPLTIEDETKQREIVDKHFELISKLSKVGASKFNNAILKTVRFIMSNKTLTAVSYDNNAKLLNDLFFKDKFDTLDETDSIYLVERVYYDEGESYYIQLNSWQIDTRITKAVFMRSLVHEWLSEKDRKCIQEFYNLDKYYKSIKVGGINDTNIAEYVKAYNHYLYEFFKRSNSHDNDTLEYYLDKSKYTNMLVTYNKGYKDNKDSFSYELSIFNTLEQTLDDIDEFCNNIKFYAKRLYEVNYPENMYTSGDNRGNKHYSKQFKIWDRYLRIYDLYKEYMNAGKPIGNAQINAIGNKIVKEFKLFEKYKPNDLRKEIIKGYENALKLIEQSTQGYLP